MKKFISMLMVLCMLFTIAPMGIVSVSATGEESTESAPTPYFQLDIGQDESGATTVADSKSSGATVSMGSGKSGSTDTPVYGFDSNNDVEYLTFASAGDSASINRSSRVLVTFPDESLVSNVTTDEATGTTTRTFAEGLTMEAWVRPGTMQSGEWGGILSYGTTTATPDSAVDIQLRQTANVGHAQLYQAANRIVTKNYGANVDGLTYTKETETGGAMSTGAWTHVAMTRTYIGKNDVGLEQFESKIYINGTQVGTTVTATQGYRTTTTTGEDGETETTVEYFDYNGQFTSLAIGGYAGDASRAFFGDIASVSVYKEALEGSEILDSYIDAYETYYPSEEEGDPTEPYFELEIGETEDGVLTVADKQGHGTVTAGTAKASNTTSNADPTGAYPASHKPVYKTDEDNGVSYLQFSSVDATKAAELEAATPSGTNYDSARVNGQSRVFVTFPDSRILTGTSAPTISATNIAEGITVEAWAKTDGYHKKLWNGMFAIGSLSGSDINANEIEFRNMNGGSYRAKNSVRLTAGTEQSMSATDTSDQWAHYVYTREYTPATTADDGTAVAAKFTTKVYIDSVLKATWEDNLTSTNGYLTSYGKAMTIGAPGTEAGGYGRSFIGGIAEFKVYRTALNAEQIETKYDESVETYYPPEVIDPLAPYFDLEISIAEDGTGSVSDAEEHATVAIGSSSSSSSTDPLGTAYKDHKPTYGTDTENGVKYLKFASWDGTSSTRNNGSATLKATFPDTRIVTGLTDDTAITNTTFAQGLTMETWVRPTANSNFWGAMFAYGTSSAGSDNYCDIQFRQQSGNGLQLNKSAYKISHNDSSNGNGTNGQITVTGGLTANAWQHIVLTRTYDGLVDGKATFTSKVYKNGVLVGTATSVQGSTNDVNNAYADTYKYLTIGGFGGTGDRAFVGDIADFKVYTYAFDAAKAAANYAAEAPTYDPYGFAPTKGKLFEMDLTDCTPAEGETAQTLEVKATAETDGYVSSISYGMHTALAASNPTGYPLQAPNVKTETVDGNEIKYLEFSHLEGEEGAEEWTNKKSSVAVTMKDLNTNIANNDKLAVEMWARSRDYGVNGASDAAGRFNRAFFSYGNNTRTSRSSAFSGWQGSIATTGYVANNFNLRFDGVETGTTTGSISGITAGICNLVNTREADHGSIANGQDKWTHYFVTREWIKDADVTTTKNDGKEYGRWQSTLYVNGMEQSTVMSPAADEEAVTRQDYDYIVSNDGAEQIYNTLLIGNDAYGIDNAFCGDIAAFTLYSGDYTAGDAFVAYMTSAEAYGYDVSGDVLNMTFYDQDGIEITSSTEVTEVTEVNIKNLMLRNRASAFVVIAAYEDVDGGGKVLSRCEILTAADFETITNGDDTYLVANKSMPINQNGEEITDLKMFIWESATNIVPVASPHCL